MDEIVVEAIQVEDAGHEGSGLRGVGLPLVSVIVINYNYGRFLPAAVDSVLRQTYPRVEIIVVENGSTDDSAEVLRGIVARAPEVKVVPLMPNRGQSGAALAGLAEARGAYIVFLDADDLLLPHCVATHIYVHLSLRVHVGFTSGDMLQLVGDQVVLGTEEAFNRTMQAKKGKRLGLVRPFRPLGAESWPDADLDTTVLETLRFVSSGPDWLWAPTSANCFRRDALDLFIDKPELPRLITGTDLYLCLCVNAISGSVLIDEALAVYRIHGRNQFSNRAQLDHVVCYDPARTSGMDRQARAYVVEHLIEQAERFVGRGWDKIEYLRLLRRLDRPNPDEGAPHWSRRSLVASGLVRRFHDLAPLFGRWILIAFLVVQGVPLTEVVRLASARPHGRIR
jgi:glycosyltransferase involved in cell wall biosynthesis